jgi:hypothetical protein
MMTIKDRIIEFFEGRENKPVTYYTLLQARLGNPTRLGQVIRAMLEEGELVEVPRINGIYLRLVTEDDNEPVE